MSYIGSTPTTQSFIAGTDYFNGNGSTVNFTLSRSVNSVNDIEVVVNNVEQIPSGYSVSGTTLTFSAAPSAGTSNVYVRYLSTTNLSLAIPAGTSATFNTITATTVNTTSLTTTNGATIQGLTVGKGAGAVATNTVVGYQALNSGGGGQDTAVGYQAGYSANISSAYATYIGYRAGYSTTTGIQNVAVGNEALRSNTTANDNVAVGYQAAYTNTVGGQNICIGRLAGYTHNNGDGNVFIGYQAGTATTGSFNSTFVGRGAGSAMTGGTKNVIIGTYSGNQSGLDIRTTSNNVVLSDGDGNIKYAYESSSNTTKMPDVYTNTSAAAANVVILSSGTICRSTSSLKYKRDVQDATHGLAEVLTLRPVTYKGKATGDGETVFGGLIAEEVHEAGLTEFVQYAADGSPDALAYGNMVSLMVKAIQEQQTLITALTTRITALENNNATQ